MKIIFFASAIIIFFILLFLPVLNCEYTMRMYVVDPDGIMTDPSSTYIAKESFFTSLLNGCDDFSHLLVLGVYFAISLIISFALTKVISKNKIQK